MFARNPVRILGLAVAVGLLSCAGTGQADDDVPQVRGALERLAELQPTDIAVAPIRDQTDGQRVPLDLFRGAFIDTLVERHYSPLSPSYVDANWVEASFKGTPPPDALLMVAITSWDPAHLYSTGKVEVSADVGLFQGGDTTGEVLWQLSLAHSVDLGDRGRPPAPGEDLIPRAVRLFAQEALDQLPVRDPVAARKATATQ